MSKRRTKKTRITLAILTLLFLVTIYHKGFQKGQIAALESAYKIYKKNVNSGGRI